MIKFISYFASVFFLFSIYSFGQISANLESLSQYYLDDDKIKLSGKDTLNRFRSNSYLNVKYDVGKFTVGAQLEAYEPQAILNFAPSLDKTNLGTYFVRYNDEEKGISATAGHLYEQFGSGLALRTWEDRQLGILNSIVGGRAIYAEPEGLFTMKALFGKQRIGFELSDSYIFGTDADFSISNFTKSEKLTSSVGFSFVNKNESNNGIENYKDNVSIYSSRGKLEWGNFSFDLEYNYKTKDAISQLEDIDTVNTFDGSAFLVNLGYSKKGFGISGNLRRLENFAFYSERAYIGNTFNEAVLNYIPSLTKQFDYSLDNIYVYQSQPSLTFLPQKKAGEIGSQFDIYYQIPKGTKVGGKYGTNLLLNLSNWYGLKGRYRTFRDYSTYSTEFLTLGEKYYSSIYFEIRRKMNKNWNTAFNFLNQYYNTFRIEETQGEVNAQTIVFDNNIKFKNKYSVKVELQHQWADDYHGNWFAGLLEYNFLTNWSLFVNDLYNYGNEDEDKQIHYYTTGMVFRKNKTRIAAQYGRQRGGVTCVGGVCRFVPESNGFSLNITTSL